jgi:soluble lytic murein transglycosylase-like protein
MRNVILILLALLISTEASAKDFEKKYYYIIKDIMWAADKVEIPREILLALCWNESSFRTKGMTHVDGGTLSYGICQIKLDTAQYMDKVYKHKILVTAIKLEDPKFNAFYAAKFLKFQFNRYDGNWMLAIDAYNKFNAIGINTKYVKRFIGSLKHIKAHIKVVHNENN